MALKISELIDELLKFESIYGDIECRFIYDGNTCIADVDSMLVAKYGRDGSNVVVLVNGDE